MPIFLKVDDSSLKGFSEPAIDKVEVILENYVTELLREIDHVERGRLHSVSGNPEITVGTVETAKQLLQSGLGVKPMVLSAKIIRIIAVVSSLIVGIMYDGTQLHDQKYMLMFILTMAVAILFGVLSVIKE